MGLGKPTCNKCECALLSVECQVDPVSDETHFVFSLEQPYDINHLTVFLTGAGMSPWFLRDVCCEAGLMGSTVS